MAKKLKAELELDNSKAKRQAEEIGESADSSFDKAAEALERMSSELQAALTVFQRLADGINGTSLDALRSVESAQPAAAPSPGAEDAGDDVKTATDRITGAFDRTTEASDKLTTGIRDVVDALRRAADSLSTIASGMSSSKRSTKPEHTDARSAAKAAKKEMDDAEAAAAKSFERMAAAAGKTADGLGASSKTLLRIAGSFGGMLAGTAARAIALKQPEGSTAQKALDYGGSALQGAGQGAMIGSMLGPLGTAIGAIAGFANAIAEKWLSDEEEEQKKRKQIEKTNEENREFVSSMLAAQERTDKFRTMIENLGDTERSLAERQAEVAAEIKKRIEEEKLLKSGMKSNSGKFADEADQKNLRQNIKDYQANHAELVRLQQLQKSLEDDAAPKSNDQALYQAVDSLSRIGGNFAGGDSAFRDLQRTNEKQLKALEKIESNTGRSTRGGTF